MNKVPAATCDCHIHVFGPEDQYPAAPTSPFATPNAPLSAYREIMKSLGIDRVVIVQSSVYGKDNRCTVDAITELGSCARGVAVVGQEPAQVALDHVQDGRACQVLLLLVVHQVAREADIQNN